MNNTPKMIGVISDTHGLLRDEVFDLFDGVDLILHAGDIGNMEIITSLNNIAKTISVIGNTDNYYFMDNISKTEHIRFENKYIYLIHNVQEIDINLSSAGVNLVVFGHTHQPDFFYDKDILFFNPGSAGPKRRDLPISVGIIEIAEGKITPKIKYIKET